MTRNLSRATLCSTLAIATALLAAPRPAAAQFIGDVISQTGANAHLLGNGQLQVNVTSPQAVINWSATGSATNGLVTFQQAGAVVEYQGNGNFAVLNRVFPTATGSGILLNGSIMTSINGQNGGGTVFFYSPNGIVIGANAMIDVGSLGLTTSNISDDGAGNWLTGFGAGTQTITFQPSSASGYIRVDPGATVGVFGQSNFIALVAPRIDLQGTIKTDGVAALVAAEAATMTIRDTGLWDIEVDTGTTDPQGIYMTGAIARNAAAVGTDHRAYLVSVAKNDAMTMLFGSGTQLGFEIAGSAGVEDNAIILSAGQNVTNGIADGGGSSDSSIAIDGANISSNLYGSASGSIDLNSNSAASTFGGSVNLLGHDLSVRATNFNLSIGGALTATADAGSDTGDATAGNITVGAYNGHTLNVAGGTTLFARGFGGSAESGVAGSGTGGHILVQAYNGGHLVLANGLNARANGFGGTSGGGTGGEGHGGLVELYANAGNSTISVTGATTLLANGTGGDQSCDGCLATGGKGFGGEVYVNGGDGSGNAITLGSLNMNAQGVGGIGGLVGGEGHGGQSHLASGDGTVISFSGNYLNFADGIGGAGDGNGSGGAGFGGNASIGSFGAGGGSITFNGTGAAVHVTAEGFGGAGGLAGGDGGYAQGGNASIYAPGVAINSPSRLLYVSAYGLGGNATAGIGGNAIGGYAALEAVGAITGGLGSQVQAFGQGGNGVAGGDGQGGSANINVGTGAFSVTGGANLIYGYGLGGTASGAGAEGGDGDGGEAAFRNTGTGTVTLGATTIAAYGTGGAAVLGEGGDSSGGHAQIYLTGGTTNLPGLTLDSKATGGAGVSGGDATGGWSNIYGTGGNANFSGDATFTSLATGGAGSGGAGGDAQGGRARVNADGADYHFSGKLTLVSNAVGGAGTTGGNANGPLVPSESNSAIYSNKGGSVIVDGDTVLNADATGGNALAGSGGNGGSAIGGNAEVIVSGDSTGNGLVDLNKVTVTALATGGNGGSGATGGAGGAGGDAEAGTAELYIANSDSGTNSLSAGAAYLYAWGIGGNGGTGGSGASGGTGGAGGAGTGGTLYVLASSGNGDLDLTSLWAIAYADGGEGGSGGTSTASGIAGGAGGNGGQAQGGVTVLGSSSGTSTATTNGTVDIGSILMFNDSYGGHGGNGGIGTTGPDGDGGNGGDALTSFHQIQARGGTVTIGTLNLLNDQVGGNGGIGGPGNGTGGDAYTSDIFFYATNRNAVESARGQLTIGTVNARSTAHNSTGSVAGQSIALGGHQLFVQNGDADFGTYTVDVVGTDAVDPTSYADPIRILNGTVNATGAFTVNTDNHMSVVLDGGSLGAGSVTLGATDFEYDLTYSPADNRGTITAGTIGISSGQDIILDAKLVSSGALGLNASGLIDLGDLNAAGNIDVHAGSSVTLGNIVSGGYADITGGGALSLGAIGAGGFVNLSSDTGSVGAGNLSAAGDIDIGAGTTVSLGTVTSNGGYVDIAAQGSITAGAASAADYLDFYSANGPITLATLSAGGNVELDGGGALTFGNTTAGGWIDFESGAAVNGGNLVAAYEISGDADGAILLGNLTSSGSSDDGFSVGIGSGTSVTVGNVSGTDSVGFATPGAITTGTLDSGADVLIMASGNMNLGAISAGSDGRIYLADSSMFIDAGGGGEDDSFDPELVFAAVPVPTAGSITVNGAISGGSLQAAAGVDFTSGTIDVAGLLYVEAGEDIATGNVQSGLSIDLTAGDLNVDSAGSILIGDVSSDGSIHFSAAGSVHGGDFTADGDIGVTTGAGIILDDVTSGGSVGLFSGTTIQANAITAGGGVTLVGGGAIDVDDVIAGAAPVLAFGPLEVPAYDIAINSGAGVNTGSLQATNNVLVAAVGNMSTGAISAGGAAILLGDATISTGAVNAGGLFYIGGTAAMETAGTIGDDFSLDALDLGASNLSGGTVTIGGAVDVGEMSSFSEGSFSGGAIDGGPVFIGSNAAVSVGNVNASGYADLVAYGGSMTTGTIDANSVDVAASTSIQTGAIVADEGIDLDAGGTLTTANLTAGDTIEAESGGAMQLGNLSAGLINASTNEGADYDIGLHSLGTMTTGSISAADNIGIAAVGNISTGAINAGGGFMALGGGDMAFGAISSGAGIYLANYSMMGEDLFEESLFEEEPAASGGSITVAGQVHGGEVIAAAGTSFTSGAVSATYGGIAIDAGTTIATGALTGSNGVALHASTGISVGGPVIGNGGISLYSSSGPINLGGYILSSSGLFGTPGDVSIETAGTITGTTINAGGSISIWGNDGVTMTNLQAVPTPGPGIQYGYVDVGSAHNVSLGTVSAANGVSLAAGGNLSVGETWASEGVSANVGGTATFAAIHAGGTVSISGWSAPTLSGLVSTQALTPTGSNVQINGAVAADNFYALVGGNLTTQGIQASTLDATVAGTAIINGMWNVGETTLSSNDITIGTSGGISGNSIELFSTNAAQTVIGNGLTTTAYLLDGTEFGKLSAPFLQIVGRSDASAAIDMVIGDLTLTPYEGLSLTQFAVRSAGEETGGVMRVVGDMIGNNFGSQNIVDLEAGRVEVDAASATIALQGAPGVLGGVLVFNTPHLHVAEAAILDQLAVDQNYTGRDLALQTPTATAHPDGIVRADEIYVDLDTNGGQAAAGIGTLEAAPYSVLFQNTGTLATRAGFVASYAEISSPETAPAGAIDMVVNGQVVTEEGTLTGAQARDALMEDEDPARFTASSTINGCGVGGGACVTIPPPPPPPPVYDPGPPIADQIVVFNDVPVDEQSFGNEEAIEDNEEDGGTDSATSPIDPPNPLFDTRPLDIGDETDEPISGGGNPALIGSGVNPAGKTVGPDEEKEKEKEKQKQQKKEQK